MTVSQYLDFNVFRVDDAFLHEHFCRAEGLSGFRDHSGELLSELFLVVAPSNASAATARSGLDHHRIADAARFRKRLLDIVEITGRSGRNRNASLSHGQTGLRFVSHSSDHLGTGPDKRNPLFCTESGQFRVFRQESIAGMNGVAAGFNGEIDDSRWI